MSFDSVMKGFSKRIRRSAFECEIFERRRRCIRRRIVEYQQAVRGYLTNIEQYRHSLVEYDAKQIAAVARYNTDLIKLKAMLKKKPRSSEAYLNIDSKKFINLGRFNESEDFSFLDGTKSCCSRGDYRTCYVSGPQGARFHDIMRNGNFVAYRLATPIFKCPMYDLEMYKILKRGRLSRDVSTLILEYAPIAYADEIVVVRGRQYSSCTHECINFLPINMRSFVKFQQELAGYEISLVSDVKPHSWIWRRFESRILRRSWSLSAEAKKRIRVASPGSTMFYPSRMGGEHTPDMMRAWETGLKMKFHFYVTKKRLGFS